MWNLIKWILLLVGGVYVIRFIFNLIGDVFSFLVNLGSIWFIILIVIGIIIYKFWDDIVFEYEWWTGKYDKKKSLSQSMNKTNTHQKVNEVVSNPSKQPDTKTPTEQVQKSDGTFTFIDGKYTDYVYKKEEMLIRWAEMLHNSNLTPEHQGYAGYLGPNWYPSAYNCYSCGDELFKTVFPVGREFQVYASGQGQWNIKRAFTCLSCEIIYAPKPGYRYTEEFIYYKAPSDIEYREKTMMMGINGTTEGRADI